MDGTVDAGGVLRANRVLYEAGEYHGVSAALLPAATQLVAAAEVQPGQRVLDVGAGDGSVAALCRDRGADVVACDLSPVQMVRAVARCPGMPAVAGDAGRMPFADASFDAVLSSFGAVIAPDPETTAAELFRVCRPGGLVVLTAWPPDSFMGELNAAVRAAAPDPAAFPDQELDWGVPETASARCAPYADEVTTERRSFVWDPAARSAAGAADCAARYLGSLLAGVDIGAERTRIAVRHQGPDGLVAEFLLVTARKSRS
ncbi:class I SAM-dependent methyltransferase [Nocardioides antri]|uniref:Class I SAM-dependent methyltransferase n=1 Tax=Nocardioides antri TaxID=2607659 RepID=A0A5B1M963_9ACTN|nr:class I SAM-dependent methyltransferase [Nocardioides antri]KAA1428230.1 class I SAM-dependent methyltransferase [Nocardioides antri]